MIGAVDLPIQSQHLWWKTMHIKRHHDVLSKSLMLSLCTLSHKSLWTSLKPHQYTKIWS